MQDHYNIQQIHLNDDVYVLVDDELNMLLHENLFLSDLAKSASKNTARSYASDLLSFTKATKSLGGWKSIIQSQVTGYLHGELFQSRSYALATMIRQSNKKLSQENAIFTR